MAELLAGCGSAQAKAEAAIKPAIAVLPECQNACDGCGEWTARSPGPCSKFNAPVYIPAYRIPCPVQSFYSKHLHIPPPSRTLANKTMTFRHAWGTPSMQQGLLVIQCQPPPCPSVFHAVPGIYNIEFDDSESAPLLFYGFSFSLEVAYPPLSSLFLLLCRRVAMGWDTYKVK